MIEQPVILIGLGGIGSPTAVEIARIGCRQLVLVDPDTVEEHNRRNQVYAREDVGKPKVKALETHVRSAAYGAMPSIVTKQMRARGNPADYQGIVIVAVDELPARREIFAGVRLNGGVDLFIEAGAAGSIGIVYALDPTDLDQIAYYEKTLADSASGAGQNPCVDPVIGAIFAGVIGKILMNYSLDWRPWFVEKTEIGFQRKPFIKTFELKTG